ncbi:MAG: cytochrome c3 family protein [Rubripirellula sp.]
MGLIIVCLLVTTLSPFNATIMKPGDLTTPHAQILAGTLDSQRCGACHPQASASGKSWFDASNKAHQGVSQSDRCLTCHHGSIERDTAMLAHNLPSESLQELLLARRRFVSKDSTDSSWHDLLPGPAVAQDDVECATCHREHQGPSGDLLAISDQQCQTCHADRFGGFATAHPDWVQWPYGRGGTIAFNHATHAEKHFPATLDGSTSTRFDCATCHARTANNELSRTTSFEQACQSCHDASLKLEASEGLNLLALPTLSEDAAAEVQPWPEAATGFFDGTVTPLAELYIRHDPVMATALRKIPSRNFSDVSSSNAESVASAITLARGLRTLLDAFAKDGQTVFTERTEQSGHGGDHVAEMLQSLSPQLIQQATSKWFDSSNRGAQTTGRTQTIRQMNFQRPIGDGHERLDTLLDESIATDSLLADPLDSGAHLDPLANDPLANDPLLQATTADHDDQPTFDAASMLPLGGWYRDDVSLAIRYRGAGHDDPVLKATIEMLAQLPPGDSVRERLLKTRSVAACTACHSGAVEAGGTWLSMPLIGRRSEFTKFSHGSHLNVAQLADCRHCHRVENNSQLTNAMGGAVDFAPLGREACVDCHTPHAAGDSCTKCHRYHIDLR